MRFTIPSGVLADVEVVDVATLSGPEAEKVSVQQGVMITNLGDKMVGLMQGLAVGDVIVAWNDIAIHSLSDFQTALKTNPNRVRAIIQRGTHQQLILQIG